MRVGAEKSPPRDRGELYLGRVAVFSRPFSGLLPIQTPPSREVSRSGKKLSEFDKNAFRRLAVLYPKAV